MSGSEPARSGGNVALGGAFASSEGSSAGQDPRGVRGQPRATEGTWGDLEAGDCLWMGTEGVYLVLAREEGHHSGLTTLLTFLDLEKGEALAGLEHERALPLLGWELARA